MCDTILPALYQGRDVVATVTAAGGLEGKKMGRGGREKTVGKGRGEWEGEVWRQMEEGEIRLHFFVLWCPYPTEYFFFSNISVKVLCDKIEKRAWMSLVARSFAYYRFKKVEYETLHPNSNPVHEGSPRQKVCSRREISRPHQVCRLTALPLPLAGFLRNKLSKSAVSDGQLLTSPQRLAGSDKVQNEPTGKTSFNCLER